MIIEQAKEVLKIEAQSILGLVEKIGPEFEKAVQIILKAQGRVILTGIGKSGLIGRKIAATLNSTGTPSLYLHPAEAIHGDLGMVTPQDIVIAISNSGETPEVNSLLPLLRQIGAPIIAFTGRMDSHMAAQCDVTVDVGVEREACPLGLAPTASTTAALAMGDAMAVALLSCRRFNPQDFRKFHPGGNLGERLKIKVKEVMLTDRNIPLVRAGASVRAAIEEINVKDLGATLVVDDDGRLLGIVTDGDLRRALLAEGGLQARQVVEEIMTPAPKTIDEDQLAEDALQLMELFTITLLVIVDRFNRVCGVVHLHDLLGREEFRTNGNLKHAPRTGD